MVQLYLVLSKPGTVVPFTGQSISEIYSTVHDRIKSCTTSCTNVLLMLAVVLRVPDTEHYQQSDYYITVLRWYKYCTVCTTVRPKSSFQYHSTAVILLLVLNDLLDPRTLSPMKMMTTG